MTRRCETPIPPDELVSYWADDLEPERLAAIEDHLMGCESCSRASERIAAVTETLRGFIPPLLSRAAVESLRAKGARVVENPMLPGERREVHFPRDVDVLLHVLRGLDLTNAASVSFVLRDETTRRVLVEVDEAPFEPNEGAVLVACQLHYADLPPDNVAEVRVRDPNGVETVTEYTILHRFDSP